MLHLSLAATETEAAIELSMEHSLDSLSKWESIHEKPFYGKDGLTPEETMSYIEQMCLTPGVPTGWANRLTDQQLASIMEYMQRKYTATWFRDDPNQPKSREIVTAEIIYYWMITFQIPFEADKWHLNKLMTLIKVCSAKQTKPKKMNKHSAAQQQRMINEQRRAALGTSG